MSASLNIAPGLDLDPDYLAGRSIAVLGKKGAGKTHLCRVLVEEFSAAHVQTIVLDPMGVFWGLRASRSGAKSGLPIPIFGGEHGDAPLEPSAGTLMADLAVDEGLSMVLDLSGFSGRGQERAFAAAFLDRLYRRNESLVHLVVDEADLFAPQKPQPGDRPLLATMENIVRRGRNRGIGTTLATQRPAVLNKDVLTQVDALVAMRMTGPQDRDAIRTWVAGQGDDESWSLIAPSLPGLANGESWWWVPEKAVLRRAQVRLTNTFDSSPTHKRGAAIRAPKMLAAVDLDRIAGLIAATVERAKASDPRELQRCIRDLEKRNRDLEKQLADRPTTVERVEVESVPESLLAALGAAASTLASIVDDARRVNSTRTAVSCPPAASGPPAREAKPAPPSRPEPVVARGSSAAETTGPTAVAPARMRLLLALADLEEFGIGAPPRSQVALWAGVSPRSSGFANNLGGLSAAGLLHYPEPGMVALTASGRDLLPTDRARNEVTNEALHEKVRTLIAPARWRIIRALIDAAPESMTRAELAQAIDVSKDSSGFANNLGALRTQGLLTYPQAGEVQAAQLLFLEGKLR